MKKLTSRSWGVSNEYKVYKLNQLIRGWVNYYKIGSMKGLCERLDGNIRYRLRMCIETLENAKEQSKEPYEAGCTPLGGIQNSLFESEDSKDVP